MVLSEDEIREELLKGTLLITPQPTQLQFHTSSLDLRLSNVFDLVRGSGEEGADIVIDLAVVKNPDRVAQRFGRRETLTNKGSLNLEPGEFVLAYTLEHITLPPYLAARVEGRSSYARLGISVHQTAPTVHAKWSGQLRLEIINNGPFICKLSAGLRICQLIFERLGRPAKNGKQSIFQHQSTC